MTNNIWRLFWSNFFLINLSGSLIWAAFRHFVKTPQALNSLLLATCFGSVLFKMAEDNERDILSNGFVFLVVHVSIVYICCFRQCI